MKLKYLGYCILCAFAAIAACSTVKKDDPEQAIRLFVNTFQNNLALSEQEILKQFETKQSSQSILSVIKVLQNKEQAYLSCEPLFAQAEIVIHEKDASVRIPVTFKSNSLESEFTRDSQLILWLKVKNNAYTITKLEGEEFYNAYTSIKNEMAWSVSKKEQLLKREPNIRKAREFQEKYDSVIWFANYYDKTYFYVVNGAWDANFFESKNPESPLTHTMGLIDENGHEIIPVEYELIGNPGLAKENIFEVRKDGKTGYINLDGKVVIEPLYDMVIPYESSEIFAIVKDESGYGTLNSKYEYHEGLSKEQQEYISGYEFIPSEFKFSATDQSLLEIPNEEFMGYGALVPPSYWVQAGIFNPLVTGFVTEEMSMRAFTEYIETKKTFFENAAEKVNTMITTIRERYLEGREEFYTHHQLVFVNENLDTLAFSDKLWGTGEFYFKRHGSILEVKSIVENDDYYYEETTEAKDYNIPAYTYFEFQDGTVVPLESNRRFTFTEFIKLDSSYITGSFLKFDPNTGSTEESSFLSDATLLEMRNEILASYGYRFKDETLLASMQTNYSWYSPQFDSLSEIEESLTEIDKHNLTFLEKIIGPLAENASI